MESETAAEVRIFFKDKQNELKGPYTEREVQDWYGQNWFDSSFPFYFMKGDEEPTEQTEFLTLETLRTLNGIVCPFAQFKPESNNEKNKKKLARLAKGLADLSKKCDGVKNLGKRLEDVEKRLKEHLTQPPPTSSSSAATAAPVTAKASTTASAGELEAERKRRELEKTVKELLTLLPQTPSSAVAAFVATGATTHSTAAKKPEEQPEENSEHAKLASEWAAYYLDVLEAYKTDKWDRVNGLEYKRMRTTMVPVFVSEPLRQKCREVLMKKLVELDYVYCSECDSVLYNFKQILMHAVTPRHNDKSDEVHKLQKVVNTTISEIFRPLLMSLTKKEDIVLQLVVKYSHTKSSPNLRPLPGFVDHLTRMYGNAVFDRMDNLESNRAQIVAKMIPRLKQNYSMSCKMMSELHEHIGDALTCCYECGVPTGTRGEYYNHLCTFAHITKSNAMDLITLVVNMFIILNKKD